MDQFKKHDYRRISPVQQNRLKKKIDLDENDNLKVIEDCVNDLEERIETNKTNNEELYRMILEIKDKLELLENKVIKDT